VGPLENNPQDSVFLSSAKYFSKRDLKKKDPFMEILAPSGTQEVNLHVLLYTLAHWALTRQLSQQDERCNVEQNGESDHREINSVRFE